MPYGLFKFTQLSFSTCYNRVNRDTEEQADKGCKLCVDDTQASSWTVEEHLQLLRRIFKSYRNHGLLINPKKMKLFSLWIS